MTGRFSPAELEARTKRIGREMFDRVRGSNPWIYQSDWWVDRMMQVCMRNAWLKVQAFRFMDVLPMMHSDEDVARHIREYLVHPDFAAATKHNGASHGHEDPRAALDELAPDPQRGLVRFVSRLLDFSRLDSGYARFFAGLAQYSSRMMARRFIAGSNLREAERAILKMRSRKLAFTIDVLGEMAVSQREAEQYQQIYLDLINELSRQAANWPRSALIDGVADLAVPTVNVSVKLTAIYPGLDPCNPEKSRRIALERLRPLLRSGMAAGAHIHIDMEHYAIKDLTLEICRDALLDSEFRDYPHLGIVLQAYLKDAERDLDNVLGWVRERGVPIWIRLVKGAYWDSETVWAQQAGWPCPVWEQKWQSDACFERMTRTILANHEHLHGAFASHNIRSLSHALALKRLLEVPDNHFEWQMLFGMGDPLKKAAVAMGQRCRVYTPYGELLPGMAYLIRRLLENTANESFLAQSGAEDASEDELLRDPVEIGRHASPPRPRVLRRYEYGEPLMNPFENTPHTDFTREPSRQQYQAGLAQARAQLGREVPLRIGGQSVTTGQWFESKNPSRPKEIIGRVAKADDAALERAVAAAADALEGWKAESAQRRARVLFRVAELIAQQRATLTALLALEIGKPVREADAEVSTAIDYCNYHAREMLRLTENVRRRDIAGETNEYFHTPRGVTAAITPWNFPLAVPAAMLGAAIVVGNTTVFKPASPAAVVGARLVELFEQAGLPAGVLNFLPGDGKTVGPRIAQHPKIVTIAFAGRRENGLALNKLATDAPASGPMVRRVSLALGGKNAIIVDSDADLNEALLGVKTSAFGFAGQKCAACARVIVVDEVYERFIERIVEATRTASVGAADELGTSIPPVVDADALSRVEEYVALGKQEATCALEVNVRTLRSETGGYYVGPTIFSDVPPTARIARDEIAGPVLCILRAADFDDALRLFNDSDYALAGGVYSRSPANLDKARAQAACGNLYINRKITDAMVDLQPFGGFKLSGNAPRLGGPEYLLQFCEARSVTENTLRRGFAPSEEVAEAVS